MGSNMSRKLPYLLCSFLFVISFVRPVNAQTIKFGSLAPEGSPWDKALRRIAADWKAASDGKLRVKVFAGGIAGDEPDMIRKMRINQLQGAAMTGIGLGTIVNDFYAVQLPSLIRTQEEMEYIMAELTPVLNPMFQEKGFALVAWFLIGWAHLFSKVPVETPRDAQRLKLKVDYASPTIVQAWREMGFQAIPIASTETLTALQSDLVQAFILSPLSAAALQWFGPAKNMLDLPIAPALGGIIVSQRVWERVPDDLKPKLQAIVYRHLGTLAEETERLEREAITIMLEHGLQIQPVSPQVEAQWEQVFGDGLDLITGTVVSVDLIEAVRNHVAECRNR
jgi:TRAP-type C4-dicarboxylate transport system substrate-binding protein